MVFNHDHKPNREKLTPQTAALMDKIFYSRRSLGLNVQFDNEGALDEWSFVDTGQRDRFARKLAKAGVKYAVLPNG